MKSDFKALDASGIAAIIESLGHPRWRAEEIRRWIFGKGALSFHEMTSLPLPLREDLDDRYRISTPAESGRMEDPDGTVKYLLTFDDGTSGETVLIPEGKRLTQCLSSQSGCALACAFCRTGRLGAGRNLSAGEIVDQWQMARRIDGEGRAVTNLVYMGMGEPLLNFEAVKEATEFFTADWGGGLAPPRITLSTAGIVPAIDRMAVEFPPVNLAVSLNAPVDALRDRLMPVNRKYPLADLMDALRRYPVSRRKITIEYVLLGEVNDSPVMARSLVKLLRGLHCKINLIPFNAHSGLPFSAPAEKNIDRFHEILRRAGYTAPVRRSKGTSIAAACGQLGEVQR